MRTCEKCKISVAGALRRCPLCQGDLTGEPERDNPFPWLSYSRRYSFFLRIVAFAGAVAAAVCIAVNLSLPSGGWWSMFVVAGLGSLWLTLWFVAKKRTNIPKTILWQVAVISLLALVWDWWTGWRGWSIDYVVPILCGCAIIVMSVVARILHLRIEDYIIYLILDSILGIIPLALVLCGAVRIVYPSAICVAVGIIALAALFIFEGTALRNEILRRLHL